MAAGRLRPIRELFKSRSFSREIDDFPKFLPSFYGIIIYSRATRASCRYLRDTQHSILYYTLSLSDVGQILTLRHTGGILTHFRTILANGFSGKVHFYSIIAESGGHDDWWVYIRSCSLRARAPFSKSPMTNGQRESIIFQTFALIANGKVFSRRADH